MSRLVEISSAQHLEEIVKSTLPVLVDFWAQWCRPCLNMLPVLEDVAEQYADRLTVAKVNIDQHPTIQARYSIRSIPHFMLFQNGKLIEEILGQQLSKDFIAFLHEHIPLLREKK